MNREQMNARAEKLVQKAIQKIDEHPNDARAYYELGVLLTEFKDYEQAEQLLSRALGLFKDKGDLDLLNYGLGNVLYSTNYFQKAINYFNEVNGQELKDEAILMIAQCEYALGSYKKSLAYALTVNEDGKIKDIGAKKLIADNFFSLGDFQNAKKYFDLILAKEPHNFEVNFQRGIITLVLEGKKEADRYFEVAQKLDHKAFDKMKEQIIDIQKTIIAKQKK
ncbi:tetratricopeptide repeat protein [Liquorilactobacillus mali]|uniref:tetratricopeptide repeat protein n=1 Tax=Liquorilactobacillus mali TaxID=1618 RepID=UPI0029543122|nr:tetratricopeptide repeat protein [Liquorilactobacillus mali]MDV7757183.1 tetratricopeptide repeat protein [Liquorilactobacillus mali]